MDDKIKNLLIEYLSFEIHSLTRHIELRNEYFEARGEPHPDLDVQEKASLPVNILLLELIKNTDESVILNTLKDLQKNYHEVAPPLSSNFDEFIENFIKVLTDCNIMSDALDHDWNYFTPPDEDTIV